MELFLEQESLGLDRLQLHRSVRSAAEIESSPVDGRIIGSVFEKLFGFRSPAEYVGWTSVIESQRLRLARGDNLYQLFGEGPIPACRFTLDTKQIPRAGVRSRLRQMGSQDNLIGRVASALEQRFPADLRGVSLGFPLYTDRRDGVIKISPFTGALLSAELASVEPILGPLGAVAGDRAGVWDLGLGSGALAIGVGQVLRYGLHNQYLYPGVSELQLFGTDINPASPVLAALNQVLTNFEAFEDHGWHGSSMSSSGTEVHIAHADVADIITSYQDDEIPWEYIWQKLVEIEPFPNFPGKNLAGSLGVISGFVASSLMMGAEKFREFEAEVRAGRKLFYVMMNFPQTGLGPWFPGFDQLLDTQRAYVGGEEGYELMMDTIKELLGRYRERVMISFTLTSAVGVDAALAQLNRELAEIGLPCSIYLLREELIPYRNRLYDRLFEPFVGTGGRVDYTGGQSLLGIHRAVVNRVRNRQVKRLGPDVSPYLSDDQEWVGVFLLIPDGLPDCIEQIWDEEQTTLINEY